MEGDSAVVSVQKIRRISVIGNACAGKTTLARALEKKFQLPLIHVDSIQFLAGMHLRDPEETRQILIEKSKAEHWIIDGLGPLKILEDRLQNSDLVVCLRPPLWKNYLWCLRRQVWGLFFRRPELPTGCFEATPAQTWKLFRSIWNVHHGLWPQLDRIFQSDAYRGKIVYIGSREDRDTLLS